MNLEELFEIFVKGVLVRVKYYLWEFFLWKLVRLVLFCDFFDKMIWFFIELNDLDLWMIIEFELKFDIIKI